MQTVIAVTTPVRFIYLSPSATNDNFILSYRFNFWETPFYSASLYAVVVCQLATTIYVTGALSPLHLLYYTLCIPLIPYISLVKISVTKKIYRLYFFEIFYSLFSILLVLLFFEIFLFVILPFLLPHPKVSFYTHFPFFTKERNPLILIKYRFLLFLSFHFLSFLSFHFLSFLSFLFLISLKLKPFYYL
jgi:hypothetical protein